jgi:medium-chain acyl-[acyl-carrier-protein] hydrolase
MMARRSSRTPATADRWVTIPRPRPDAHIRLLCFPHAGGGATAYRDWAEPLGSRIEVAAVQLPGRERRFHEPAYSSLAALLEPLTEALVSRLDLPFALFGHSMGARIAFELARALRRRPVPPPRRLFVSGATAPHLPVRTAYHQFPDDRLVAKLHDLNGTPIDVLRSGELLQLMLPLLRADLTLAETHPHVPEAPLDCPIRAFAGASDPESPVEEVAAWRVHTRASFRLQVLPGDHFFLRSQRQAVLAAIRRELLGPGPGPGAGAAPGIAL